MLTVSDNHIVLGGGGGGGGGDVVGAASSTDNAIARFDGTTGKLLQDSSVTINDTGNVGINGSASSTNKLIINSSSTGYTEEFRIFNSIDPMAGATRLTIQNQRGSIQINQYGSGAPPYLKDGAGIFGTGTGSFILGTTSTESTANVCLFTNDKYNSPDFIIRQNGDIGVGSGLTAVAISARLDVNGTFRSRGNATFNGQIIDNAGSSGTDGQVLKKVGGLVIWANP